MQVLDLFAGTGALGIEALSRGAARTVFVEDHPEALKGLRRNLETWDSRPAVQFLPLPVAAAVKKLAAKAAVFGLVFLDPPYGGVGRQPPLRPWLLPTCWRPRLSVVAEHSRRETLPEALGGLIQQTLRRYGDTQVAIYRQRRKTGNWSKNSFPARRLAAKI